MRRIWPWLAVLFLLAGGCSPTAGETRSDHAPSSSKRAATVTRQAGEGVAETAVRELPLRGDASSRAAEISGLAWYGDWLILLPQYPDFGGVAGDGRLFALHRAALVAFLEGESTEPLTPLEVPVVAPDIRRRLYGYEGFEAITFAGNDVYLTVEARTAYGMNGYLVKGRIAPDLSRLVVDTERVVYLPAASEQRNKSEEAVVWTGDEIMTIHEVNGLRVNPEPRAQRFTASLRPLGALPFPTVEYRITDATALDSSGRFWGINYFFPGELALRADDPLAAAYGEGPTHARMSGVARLLEFQLTETGIGLVDQPPLQLEQQPFGLHNWEGLVRLDARGFLIVTDKYPRTILGFIPYAQSASNRDP
jgi:hypothetical protein